MSPLQPFMYNLIGLLVVLFFTWKGYRRGLIRELATILSLAGAYFLAKPFGFLVTASASMEGIPPFFRTYVSMFIGAFIAYVTLSVLFHLIIFLKKLHRPWEGRAWKIIHYGGAIVGGLFGLLLLLVLSWYVLSLGQMSSFMLKGMGEGEREFDAKDELMLMPARMMESHMEGLSESFIGKVAEESNPLPEEVIESAEVIGDIVNDPQAMQKILKSEMAEEIVETESFQSLITDPEVRSLAESGDVMGLMNHPTVLEAMNDPEVLAAFEEVDLEELLLLLQE